MVTLGQLINIDCSLQPNVNCYHVLITSLKLFSFSISLFTQLSFHEAQQWLGINQPEFTYILCFKLTWLLCRSLCSLLRDKHLWFHGTATKTQQLSQDNYTATHKSCCTFTIGSYKTLIPICRIGMYVCILYACAVVMFGARSVSIVKDVVIVFTVYNTV